MKDQPTGPQAQPSRRGFIRSATGALAAGVSASALAAPQHLQRRDIRHWDADTDVLVMGSGIGGVAAAIEARRHSARVMLLEKFNVLGGSSAMSGGVCYMGGGTPLQKALGFEDSVQAMRDFMVAASGRYAPTDKIDLYCEGSLDLFQWLQDNGVRYAERFSAEKELSHQAASLYYCGCEKNLPYRDIAKPAPRGHVPPAQNQTGGRELMRLLIASARRLGTDVRTETDVERLILENDGSVAGARVRSGNKTLHIRARRGVVLAAGGFIHNPQMLHQFAPELHGTQPHWGHAGHLGHGILMSMAAGARTRNMDHGFAVLPLYPPEQVLKGVVVNTSGQRCISEDTYYGVIGHEMLFHQGGKGYLIVDAQCDYPGPDYRVVQAARANDLTTLAGQLGLPAGVLERTVAYYNEHAAQGQDPMFGKLPHNLAPLTQAPFTAYDLGTDKAFYSTQTFGGLDTTVNGQVIHAWGEPIPGLYAAGRTGAGIPVSPYYASGLCIGDGAFFGRRAGAHAARRQA